MVAVLLRPNPFSQRKLPITISLSRMLCFGRVCASCALNVSPALQGAYSSDIVMVQFYKIMIWLSSEQLFLTNKAISYSHAKMLEFCSNFFVFGRFTIYEL